MADGDPEDLDLDDIDPVAEPEEPEELEEAAEPAAEPEIKEPDASEAETVQTREQPERQPSRGETRIQVLRNELKDRDARLAETNRRIDELIARSSQPATQRETTEQRAARFALMTPQEQMAETLRESEQRVTQVLQQSQMQNAETADRTAFQSRAAVDPVYAKWAPKVEAELASRRNDPDPAKRLYGVVEREIVLAYLIGKEALARRSSKEGKREVAQAQRRVAAQRTRPSNSGSDTQAQRRQQSTAERRLENVQI